jgi:hypothetical protein
MYALDLALHGLYMFPKVRNKFRRWHVKMEQENIRLMVVPWQVTGALTVLNQEETSLKRINLFSRVYG